jgi:hypothetical protein
MRMRVYLNFDILGSLEYAPNTPSHQFKDAQ